MSALLCATSVRSNGGVGQVACKGTKNKLAFAIRRAAEDITASGPCVGSRAEVSGATTARSAPSPDRTDAAPEDPHAPVARVAQDARDARGVGALVAPAALDAPLALHLAAAAMRRVGALYAIPSAVEDFTTWRAAYAPQTALADLLTLV